MCIALIVLLYIIVLTIVMTRSHHNSLHHNHQIYNQSQKWSNVFFYTLFIVSILVFEILLTNKLDYEMSSTDIFHQLHSFLQHNTQNHQLIYQNQHMSNNHNFNGNNYLGNYIGTRPLLGSSSFSQYVPSSNSQNNSNTSNISNLSYFMVTIPLYLAYLSLMCLSFNNHSGNLWWFGIRRDFCELFLLLCPPFQIYGNIQIKLSSKSDMDGLNDNQNLTVISRNNRSSNRNNNNNTIRNNEEIITEQSRRLIAENSSSVLPRSNEASLMTFNLNQLRSQHLNDSSTNTNNLNYLDSANSNANNSTNNEINLSIDLESINMNPANNVSVTVSETNNNNNSATNNQAQLAQTNSGSALPASSNRITLKRLRFFKKFGRNTDSRNNNRHSNNSSGHNIRQHSIRSYYSAYNSDRASIKSANININQIYTVNNVAIIKNNKPLGHLVKLDMPD